MVKTARLPQQMDHERCCGQLCVAAIAGKSRQEVQEAFGGHWRGTNARHVIAALKKLGFKTGKKCYRTKKKQAFPLYCMVRIKQKRRDKKYRSHWIVILGNIIYDPCGHCNMHAFLSGQWIATSYLPFWKP